jgi:hypothetical protein
MDAFDFGVWCLGCDALLALELHVLLLWLQKPVVVL